MGVPKVSGATLLIGLSLLASVAKATEQPDYLANAFLRNAGQYRNDVTFAAALPTHEIYILRDGRVLHSLPVTRGGATASTVWVVVETLEGAVTTPAGAGQALDWHEAWPGIDMRLRIVDGRTERVFRVAPGADPARIALAFDGVRFVADGSGRLSGHAGPGTLSLSAPVAFQETSHGRVPVDVEYALRRNGSLVSFRLGNYDRSLPLTIDPLLQSTYIGFGGPSGVNSIAVDPATGDLIAAGFVGLGVPGVAGGFQSVDRFNLVFIARVDSKLRRVIQATYLGGVAPSLVARVAIHPSTGEIYVAGETTSADFPGGGGGANPVLGGSRDDGYVARFSADLRQLLQTTFTGQDLKSVIARDMAINATTGDVYVIGGSYSEAYVLRFNRELTSQLGRFTIAGNSFSYASSIAINQSTGDVYAAGYTSSTNLPKIAGGAEPVFVAEGGDGPGSYVARFGTDLTHLQTTYLPDVWSNQQPHVDKYSPRIAISPVSGEVYAAGWTWRTDVAAGGGALPTFLGGQNDTIIARLSADLTQKRGATYFGGSGFEELADLAFTPDGASVYVTGYTFSTDLAGRAGGAISSAPRGGAYVARFSSSLAVLDQTTYFTSDGNVNGFAVTVHPSTGEVYMAGRSIPGIAELDGGLQPFYDSWDTFFGTAALARFDASLAGGDDMDPDAFTFIDQFGVATNAFVTSAPIRVEGITVPVAATATNGEFSIDGGAFSSLTRNVRRGQSIRVRHRSAAPAGTITSTVFQVGTRNDNFTSTTASGADSVPAAFTFPPKNPVALNIPIESAAITVSGIDAAPAIAVVNGTYSIDGGAFTSAAGTVNGGQVVVVRHTSAAVPATIVESQLTIGGVSAAFRSTTDPVDSSVHPFEFLDVANVTPDFDAASDPIVVMGINVPVPVSVVGGEWSTDGIHFTSAPGTVTNLTPIALRRRTGSGNTTVSVTLTVGDQSDDWVLRQPEAGDTTPDPFSFTTVDNAPLRQYVESNNVTITGIGVPVWINMVNVEYFDSASGLWRSQGYLSNGATTKLRVFTGPFPGTIETLGRIGSADVTWEVHGAGSDSVPDTFDFVDRTDVAAGTRIESNTVTVQGIVGDTTLTVSGCEISVQFGTYTTAPTRITNGTLLVARITSATTAATTTSCSINIGGMSDQFSVTTAAASSGGGGGSSSGGSSSGGGGGGSNDLLALIGLAWLLARRAGSFNSFKDSASSRSADQRMTFSRPHTRAYSRTPLVVQVASIRTRSPRPSAFRRQN